MNQYHQMIFTDDDFMGLLCYKNGSLTREFIRNATGMDSWSAFEKALSNTKPGNDGNIGIYFKEQEIIPFACGIFRLDSNNKRVESFPAQVEFRALIEGQFLAKRIHAEQLGFCLSESGNFILLYTIKFR